MKIAKPMVDGSDWDETSDDESGENEYFQTEKSNLQELDTEHDSPDDFRRSNNDDHADVAGDADVNITNRTALTDSLLLHIQIPQKEQQPGKQM